jgi:hypothetical protein
MITLYIAECGCLVNHYDYAWRASFARSRKGGGGGSEFSPSVAIARPTTEMNNFRPLINRQNFRHTKYSWNPIFSEQRCLVGYEIGLQYIGIKTDKWSPSLLGSMYCNTTALEFRIYFSSDHIFYVEVTLPLPGENKTRYRIVCSRETDALLLHTSRRHFLSSCGEPPQRNAYTVL